VSAGKNRWHIDTESWEISFIHFETLLMKQKILQFAAIVLCSLAGFTASSQNWLIAGNSNTTGTNFIGTKNPQPLIFKTNNIEFMRITNNSQLGIGIINPTYCLQIQNPKFSRSISINNNFSGNEDRIGVYSSSVNAPGYGIGIRAYGGFIGLHGTAQGGNYTGGTYGVYGESTGSTGSRYGIYASASGGSFNAAGYFNGDVWAVTYNYISDRKVKTGISPLKNSLEQLMKLKPATYQFKTADYPKWGLSAGKQIGLIADEVKQVFPELVKEAVHPPEYSEDRKELLRPEEKYEGINYMGLIPVLIASIQEQQKTIEAMKDENEELRTQLAEIKQMLAVTYPSKMPDAAVSLSSARLAQNAPNPFNQKTVINYYLPQNAGNALIMITDMNGKVIKTEKITTKGDGQLTINAGELASGTYQYALALGGRLIDSKKMVLTK